MIEMPGKAATLWIGLIIAATIIIGLGLAVKAFLKHGPTAFMVAVVLTGVSAWIVANVLAVPDIAGDTAKRVEKSSNQVKSKIPVGE